MVNKLHIWILLAVTVLTSAPTWAQRIQFPPNATTGLRPIDGQVPSTMSSPAMIPINPATQAGVYPSQGFGSPTFDPYSGAAANAGFFSGTPMQGSGFPPGGFAPNAMPTANPYAQYPAYNGPVPGVPGAGQSGTMGTFPGAGINYSQPGMYPNSSPSALFPSSTYGAPNNTGSLFGGMFDGVFGSSNTGNFGGTYGQPYAMPQYPNGQVLPPPMNPWNPQGSMFGSPYGQPEILRLYQGPRFRHAWLNGNDDADALMINDSDVSLGFAIPNFLFSTQPLYLLPSFSLHQWDGPKPNATADLPALAYSAFLDSGWQSDPASILGAELGLRVGMFTDFDTANSDSLRVMGRGIGRVRLTPRLTMKAGVMYLDRNRIKLLPAGGLLWQPNPDTRFDLFFPEPKLAHYLATIGTADAWWYVGGYYGGGAWTVRRTDGTQDSIDINDIRVVLGLEWGRNDQMRDGRRVGFFEVGYVFDRELLYKNSPLDNMDLQSTFMLRAGIGY